VETYTPTFIDTIENQHFEMFPNPATDHVVILPGNAGWVAWDVTITDSFGRVRSSAQNVIIGSQYYIDLSGLAAGVYFVKMRSDNDEITERLVIR
jgi:hypothetical protein